MIAQVQNGTPSSIVGYSNDTKLGRQPESLK